MTPILRDRIDHPMAWRGCEFSKEKISFDLSARHAAALKDVLVKVPKLGCSWAKSGRTLPAPRARRRS
jgi:hypothetical protein